jgi:DsbC/DsbD-like thiol-disulfide interchange protein
MFVQRVLIGALLLAGAAEAIADPAALVQARLVADVEAIEPGKPFTVGVLLTMRPGWHIYWINPGDSGMPTTVRFSVPAGYDVGELQWPVPIQFESSGLIGYGYEGQVLLTAQVTPPAQARAGQSITIAAETDWLACKEECIPGKAPVSLTLAVGERSEPANSDLFSTWQQQLPVSVESPDSPLSVAQSQAGRLELAWRAAVKEVAFFPATSAALELADISVGHEGSQSLVTYTANIYDEAGVPEGISRGLVVYRDAQGHRRGVWVPVKVRS